MEESDLQKYWNKTYDFIKKAKNERKNVFVHCRMGVSRSAATVSCQHSTQKKFENQHGISMFCLLLSACFAFYYKLYLDIRSQIKGTL